MVRIRNKQIALFNTITLREIAIFTLTDIYIYMLIVGRIPLTFVLAFYMNHIVQRWWETWKMIPWPDSIALKLNTFFPNLPGQVHIYMYIIASILELN